VQTIDVFAVVALSGILSRLLTTGTVLVATSNKAPEDLNQAGPSSNDYIICFPSFSILWISCIIVYYNLLKLNSVLYILIFSFFFLLVLQDGMQRDIFLDLLSKLDENCNKILVGTEKDYRRLIPTEGSTQVYFQLFFS